ncbi:hypothetical protein CB1_000576092 [Camelus ferus]|nr:hypothetical protein CB1_000576092 [Camelus ferus]
MSSGRVIADTGWQPQNPLLGPLKTCFYGGKGQGKSWAPAFVLRGKFQIWEILDIGTHLLLDKKVLIIRLVLLAFPLVPTAPPLPQGPGDDPFPPPSPERLTALPWPVSLERYSWLSLFIQLTGMESSEEKGKDSTTHPFSGCRQTPTPAVPGAGHWEDSPQRYVDDVISRIDRMFPEMSIHLSRPNGTSAMLLSRFWNEGGSLPGLASMGRAFRTRPVWGPLQTQHRLVLPSTGNSCFPGSRHVQQDRGIEHGGFLTAVLSAGDRAVLTSDERTEFRKIRSAQIGISGSLGSDAGPLINGMSHLVTLGKVLKVIVVMRSLFIDRTIVKGYNENVYTEDGKLDIWSKSNYQVFQKVTDHATTALLHYQLPQMPDVVVRSFMGPHPHWHAEDTSGRKEGPLRSTCSLRMQPAGLVRRRQRSFKAT